MKTTTTILSTLLLAGLGHAQDMSLKMTGGGGLGQNLQVQIDGDVGKGYLLLMSGKYESTALPAPHVSPIDVGLDLLTTSVSAPGFVGITPANLVFPIPNTPAFAGITVNFQALEITGPVLSDKSNPWRLSLSEVGEMSDALELSNFKRAFGTATALDNGDVLLAGGSPVILPYSAAAAIFSPVPGSSTAEVYNTATQSFEVVGNMTTTRSRHTATKLQDGRVLITGGANGTLALSSAEIYDPATKTFSSVGSMSAGRIGHTATLLVDGRVWIAGGSTAASSQASIAANALNTSELFDPNTNTFSPASSIFFNRSFHTATLLNDGRVIIAGGYSNSGGSNFVLSSVMEYTPDAAGGSILNKASLPAPRVGHGAFLRETGAVMIVGGLDGIYSDAVAEKTTYSIDASANTVNAAGSLQTEVAFPNVIRLDDGNALVTAGMRGVGGSEQPLHISSKYIEDPFFGGWTSTGNLSKARYGSTMARAGDSNIVVFHGVWFGNLLHDNAEIYQQ